MEKIDSKSFTDRKLNRMPRLEMRTLATSGMLEADQHHLADDWIMVIQDDATDTKYGRVMYSKKLNKLRYLTMGEFYGSGVVD